MLVLRRAGIAVMVLVLAGCGERGDVDPSAAAADTAPEPAADSETAATAELDRFCAAVALVDTHDGTTDPSVAVPALEEFRDSAPAAIREDVVVVVDTMIVSNFPDYADPSTTEAPFTQLDPARARLGAFVETNCPPSSAATQ